MAESAGAEAARPILGRIVSIGLAGLLAAGGALGYERERSHKGDVATRDERARLLESEVATARASAETTRAETARERAELAVVLSQAKTATDEARRKLSSLADKLGESEQAREKAERRARDAEAVLDALRKKKVNVERLAGIEPAPKVSALVVQVDEGELPPVAVLNAGAKDSIAEGDVFYVVRGGREVARLVVEQVRETITAARVARCARGEKVRAGDEATTTPP